jgi:transposase
MRGEDLQQHELFSYGSLEQRIPADHPLRPIRIMVDEALREMSACFDEIYGEEGRKLIPPERLLRALLLQMLYTVRSERLADGTTAVQPAVPLVCRVIRQ